MNWLLSWDSDLEICEKRGHVALAPSTDHVRANRAEVAASRVDRHMSCSEARVKLYDLLVDGYHTPRSAKDIADLYQAGRLRKNDPCRVTGTTHWKTVDELFPLLKYDSSRSLSLAPGSTDLSILDRSDSPGAPQTGTTSALKAGWICFAFGLAISWFFPLGNAFFSVALITAVVAMCTHQVNRGLTLLISSFCGIILCAAMFFVLAVGTVVVTGTAAVQKANADLKRASVVAQQQARDQLNSSAQQPPTSLPSMPLPSVMVSNLTIPRPTVPSLPSFRSDDQTRRENVRKAEMERDRINAKEQRIQQLQKSIDSLDEMVRKIRHSGGNESDFVKQRDELLRQKWNLQR